MPRHAEERTFWGPSSVQETLIGALDKTRPRFAYDIFEECRPAHLVLETPAGKCTLLVMKRLQHGLMHLNALRRDIKPITQKLLTQTLKCYGLISRHAFPTFPVTLEYRLMRMGSTLGEPVSALIH
jgi:DNA-binding HxlR family transcriptional regulator